MEGETQEMLHVSKEAIKALDGCKHRSGMWGGGLIFSQTKICTSQHHNLNKVSWNTVVHAAIHTDNSLRADFICVFAPKTSVISVAWKILTPSC